MKGIRSEHFKVPANLLLAAFFVLSLISVPQPAEAVFNSSFDTQAGSVKTPFGDQLLALDAPKNVVVVTQGDRKVQTELRLDPASGRIYQYTEIAQGKTQTLRYLYDDDLRIVTVLFSYVPRGEKPLYDNYYRYALGSNDTLSLILEEGWVKKQTLIPLRIYDYYAEALEIRTYDKTGKLLKIESSRGFQKIFIYSQEGRLLTVQETDQQGTVRFFDQLLAGSRGIESPITTFNFESMRYALPTRDKEKRMESRYLTTRDLITAPSYLGESNANLQDSSRFLEWLEAAHPFRAGPILAGAHQCIS